MGSVAGVRERSPKANIASHLRWKGCVGDAALRGSDQGEPPQGGSPTKGTYSPFPFLNPNGVSFSTASMVLRNRSFQVACVMPKIKVWPAAVLP